MAVKALRSSAILGGVRSWIVSLAVSACGFSPGGASTGPGDGGLPGDEGVPPDTAPLGSTCWPHWFDRTLAFNPAQPLSSLDTTSGTSKLDLSLSSDELQIWFQSGSHVWTATRTTATASFDSPTLFSPANSTAAETKLAMTDDRLAFLVASTRAGGNGQFDLWISTRPHATSSFPAPSETHLKNVDTADNEDDPWISNDTLRLYYTAAPAVQHRHLVVATRDTVSKAFGAPASLDSINQSVVSNSSYLGYYEDAMLADDELVIAYSARRTDNVGVSPSLDPPATTDLWYSVRSATTNAFSPPIRVPYVNTQASEGDPWISHDGCRLYFATDVDGPVRALYEATVIN